MGDPGPKSDYAYRSVAAKEWHKQLFPHLRATLEGLSPPARILDAGCGNGVISEMLAAEGFAVSGIDLSASGVAMAAERCPQGQFKEASICDPGIAGTMVGDFDAILLVEVIEHLDSPATCFDNCHKLLRDGGRLIVTTPYHGYAKNLALALWNKWDRHFQVRHEGGHIKFWSKLTLTAELEARGFVVKDFKGWGRMPWFWKSMIVSAGKTA